MIEIDCHLQIEREPDSLSERHCMMDISCWLPLNKLVPAILTTPQALVHLSTIHTTNVHRAPGEAREGERQRGGNNVATVRQLSIECASLPFGAPQAVTFVGAAANRAQSQQVHV